MVEHYAYVKENTGLGDRKLLQHTRSEVLYA